MKTITNKQFKIHCTDSVLEYAGGGVYNFYDLSTDFWFNYNVDLYEFTEKGDVKVTDYQLLIIENKITDFHQARLKEENEDQDRSELQEDYNLYNDEYFNHQFI